MGGRTRAPTPQVAPATPGPDAGVAPTSSPSTGTQQPYGNSGAAEDMACAPIHRGGMTRRVAAGDTLWGLSEAAYGVGDFWDEIAGTNPTLVHDGTILVIGDPLSIPMQEVDCTPSLGSDSPPPGSTDPAWTRARWFFELVRRQNAAAALAFVPTLGEDLAGVQADPGQVGTLPVGDAIPILRALQVDPWPVLFPHLTADVFTASCDPQLVQIVRATPNAVRDVRTLVPQNAQFDLFLQAYQIEAQTALRVAGFDLAARNCQPGADFDLIVRIACRISQAERQEVMLAIRRLGMWETLVGALGSQHVAMVQGWIAEDAGDNTNQTLDQRIAAATNSARGVAALAAVDAVAATDTNTPRRIIPRVRELLGLGVALPKLQGDDLATEGVLGVVQAERAAKALIRMPEREYMRTVMLLELSGDESRLNQSFLMLKALAARLDEFQAGRSQSAGALEGFSDTIRGMNNTDVIDRTDVTGAAGAGIGMEQQFSMSCAQTSAIVIRSQADPIEALRHHEQNDMHMDALGGGLAREAEGALEAQSPGIVAHVRNDQGPNATQSAVNQAVTELTGRTPAVQLQAVTKYMGGMVAGPGNFTQDNYDRGIAAIRRHINIPGGYPTDQAMRLLHETNAARQAVANNTAPSNIEGGSSVPGMTNDLNGRLGVAAVTGQTYAADFDATVFQNGITYNATGQATGLVSPLPAAVVASINGILNRAAPRLESGVDVEIAVWWARGGAHAMSFLDVRGNGAGRQFLVHDTWTGQTTWVTQAQFTSGTLPMGNGLLASAFH